MPRRRQTPITPVGAQMPEEVRIISDWLDGRMNDIQGRSKVTPWNKAKLLAFQEVKDLITPTAPETPAESEAGA